MCTHSPPGSALIEILVALSLLAALALLSAPLAARNGLLLHRGRVLLSGIEAAQSAATQARLAAARGCASASGRDTTQLVLLDWSSTLNSGVITFVAVIQDRAARVMPESLAMVIPCPP
jgi:hypothetical protein